MKFYRKLESKNACRQEIINGMDIYEKEKIRIEAIHLSISDIDKTPIMNYFEGFVPTMLYQGRFGNADFIGAVVDNQHLHFYIRKPFVTIEDLKSNWQKITKNTSNIMISTIKFDMNGKFNHRKLISYVLNQDDEHLRPVEYVSSPSWGIVIHKKRQKKSDIKTNVPFNRVKTWMRKKDDDEKSAPWMLPDGTFVSDEEYKKLQLDKTIKK
jgi:hypothetical protein